MANMDTQLPRELVDMIIDFLHDDKSSLHSCCLVTRSWLASSRYHLFYSVTIDDQAQDHFGPASQNVQHRLTTLPGSVAEYIQELYISSARHLPCHSLHASALLSALEKMKRISTVRMYRALLHFDSFSSKSYPPISSLQHLLLVGVDVRANPRAFAQIILPLFPNIRTLIFHHTLWAEETTHLADVHSISFPYLQKVVLNGHGSGDYTSNAEFLQALNENISAPSLKMVDLICSTRGEVHAIGRFLEKYGGGLVKLRIAISLLWLPGVVDLNQIDELLGLRFCTALQTSVINIPVVRGFGFAANIVALYIRALSPVVHELVIQLRTILDDSGEQELQVAIKEASWSLIDEALHDCNRSITVRFMVVETVYDSDALSSPPNAITSALIVSKLPQAQNRKMLVLS